VGENRLRDTGAREAPSVVKYRRDGRGLKGGGGSTAEGAKEPAIMVVRGGRELRSKEEKWTGPPITSSNGSGR